MGLLGKTLTEIRGAPIPNLGATWNLEVSGLRCACKRLTCVCLESIEQAWQKGLLRLRIEDVGLEN